MSHLWDNQIYSILAIEFQTDLKKKKNFQWKAMLEGVKTHLLLNVYLEKKVKFTSVITGCGSHMLWWKTLIPRFFAHLLQNKLQSHQPMALTLK